LAASLATAAPPAQPLKAWRDGPVRVLLDRSEYERFGALARRRSAKPFIDEFWRRMDEGPAGAPAASVRRSRRGARSRTSAFQTNGWQEGWSTSRGRVFIVLGEPTAIRPGTAGTKALAKEVWIYKHAGRTAGDDRLGVLSLPRRNLTRMEPSCETRLDHQLGHVRLAALNYDGTCEGATLFRTAASGTS
jgi:GWxTD domain-containing protein